MLTDHHQSPIRNPWRIWLLPDSAQGHRLARIDVAELCGIGPYIHLCWRTRPQVRRATTILKTPVICDSITARRMKLAYATPIRASPRLFGYWKIVFNVDFRQGTFEPCLVVNVVNFLSPIGPGTNVSKRRGDNAAIHLFKSSVQFRNEFQGDTLGVRLKIKVAAK